MAFSYGPAKHPLRCATKHVYCAAVRSHAAVRTFDIVFTTEKTGDEQVLRFENREELAALGEAIRRVLEHDGNCSWSPDAIARELAK